MNGAHPGDEPVPRSMRALLMVKIKERGLTRAERIAFGKVFLGPTMNSWSGLTRSQAARLIDAVEGFHAVTFTAQQRVVTRPEPEPRPVERRFSWLPDGTLLADDGDVLRLLAVAHAFGFSAQERRDFAEWITGDDIPTWWALTAHQARRISDAFNGFFVIRLLLDSRSAAQATNAG